MGAIRFGAATHAIYAIVIWHAHDNPKGYHDVIAQVADDAGFTTNVRTLFNNDVENTTKLGEGKDREYFETNQGKLIDAKGVKARYVRLYSHGSNRQRLERIHRGRDLRTTGEIAAKGVADNRHPKRQRTAALHDASRGNWTNDGAKPLWREACLESASPLARF